MFPRVVVTAVSQVINIYHVSPFTSIEACPADKYKCGFPARVTFFLLRRDLTKKKKGKKKIAVHMLYKDNGCAVILAKWTSEMIAQGES